MSGTAIGDVERLGALEAAERTFQMDEEAFRAFYEETARPVWLYLARVTGDSRLADDLLQEAYYRFLRANSTFASDEHRRHYLFRIATNLARDHRRRPVSPLVQEREGAEAGRAADRDVASRATDRIDLQRAFGQLKPRERSLLLLAYGQGFSHQEIARLMGLKASSLKSLLHRARQRLIAALGRSARTGGRSQ